MRCCPMHGSKDVVERIIDSMNLNVLMDTQDLGVTDGELSVIVYIVILKFL